MLTRIEKEENCVNIMALDVSSYYVNTDGKKENNLKQDMSSDLLCSDALLFPF